MTWAPTSDAVRCGGTTTPLVTRKLSRPRKLSWRYEIDRPRLDFEQRRKKSNGLAVDVDANRYWRRDRDSFPVNQLDFRVALVEVLSLAEVVHASHSLDLAGILHEDHVEHAVRR